ncbi:unnamed protein product [Ectocarpus sp. CCAP 1310/34]|nr:unnamed protein product [Ectocarpus sp. CCAP 1310/34]
MSPALCISGFLGSGEGTCGAMAVYALLFCLSHLAADTWECTIIKLGGVAYHDILASAGLELPFCCPPLFASVAS